MVCRGSGTYPSQGKTSNLVPKSVAAGLNMSVDSSKTIRLHVTQIPTGMSMDSQGLFQYLKGLISENEVIQLPVKSIMQHKNWGTLLSLTCRI